MDFYNHYFTECHEDESEVYEIDLNDLTGKQFNMLSEIHKRYLMNKTDPGRVKRARQDIKTHRRNIRVSEDNEGNEIIEFDFRADPSTEFRSHWGYVIHDGDDIKQLFCDCKDAFYRLYAPWVKAGIATWDLPPKYKKRMEKFIKPHNKEWTKMTNKAGVLYVCKHLYALLLEFVGKDIKARPLSGVRIDPKVKARLAANRAKDNADIKAQPDVGSTAGGDKRDGDSHVGVDTVNTQDKITADMEVKKAEEDAKEKEKTDKETEDTKEEKKKKK